MKNMDNAYRPGNLEYRDNSQKKGRWNVDSNDSSSNVEAVGDGNQGLPVTT